MNPRRRRRLRAQKKSGAQGARLALADAQALTSLKHVWKQAWRWGPGRPLAVQLLHYGMPPEATWHLRNQLFRTTWKTFMVRAARQHGWEIDACEEDELEINTALGIEGDPCTPSRSP